MGIFVSCKFEVQKHLSILILVFKNSKLENISGNFRPKWISLLILAEFMIYFAQAAKESPIIIILLKSNSFFRREDFLIKSTTKQKKTNQIINDDDGLFLKPPHMPKELNDESSSKFDYISLCERLFKENDYGSLFYILKIYHIFFF